jgi:SAM-dependent methyltransferase
VEIIFWILYAITVLFGFVVFFGAPYVPSQRRDLERAFSELYTLGSRDKLVDIGSGDGKVLRIAAEHGASAVGFEINPALVVVSRFLSRKIPGVRTELANIWHVQFPVDTTVVYLFGVSRDAVRMQNKLQAEATRLGKTLKVICYGTMLEQPKPVKGVGAHYLYEFNPLQQRKT